jgi:uncharacterized repeat protein (TIGR03806 family)
MTLLRRLLTQLRPLCVRGWVVVSCLIALGKGEVSAQVYGLGAPEPVGAYLNGVMPESTPSGGSTGDWTVEVAFPNLVFDHPMMLIPAPNADELFLGTREGEVFRFADDQNATTATQVIDLTTEVLAYEDSGFLGLALHPEFGLPGSPNRGYFYVYYTSEADPVERYLILARYTIPDGLLAADTASEQVLIRHRQVGPGAHFGGDMFFGDDGFLYLPIGDQYQYTNAQDTVNNLEGGVLRIDVDQDGSRSHAPRRSLPLAGRYADEFTGNYWIPNDNPFLDVSGGSFEEYYTLGHRNPHRMTLDSVTGRIWIGEVGELSREEINVVEAGGNYGWPFREGTIAGPEAAPSPLTGTLKEPVIDFDRSEASAIIGGYVYRGSDDVYLQGKYICADYSFGDIFAVTWDGVNPATSEVLTNFTPGWPIGFGRDHDGELYIGSLGEDRSLYRLTRQVTGTPEPPALLSQAGLFSDLAALTPWSGLVPYALNTPFWSDGAIKTRWMAVPNDGTHDTPGERVVFTEEGDWQFPLGSVLVKHFELPIDDTDATVRRRLETRLLVRAADGDYYGVTYKWLPDGSDASLLTEGEDEIITIATETGTREQTWHYPSRAECFLCHSKAAGGVLGPRTHQLNGMMEYPSTSVTDNQLRALNHLGILSPAISEAAIGGMPKSVAVDDPLASLERRARSWLDSNCSYCHRPETGNRARFDARLATPLIVQGYVDGGLVENLGDPNLKVIAPGDLLNSMLHTRVNSTGPLAMPPLAKNVVDAAGVEVITRWIQSLIPLGVSGNGLEGDYYNGPNFGSLVLSRIDADVNFDWALGSPNPLVPVDNFSARWTGYVVTQYSETYTFFTSSDDGVRLWVDDILLIDEWNGQAETEHSGQIVLSAGQAVSLRLEWFDGLEDAVVKLLWSSASTAKGIIPGQYLFHVDPTNAAPQGVSDSVLVNAYGAKSADVLANDTDDMSPLYVGAVSIVQPPSKGSVAVDSLSGELVYTHDGSFGEFDRFTYVVDDPFGATSAPVTVDVGVEMNLAVFQANVPGAGPSALSDLDGDGLTDIEELAFGGNPAVSDGRDRGLAVERQADGAVRAHFKRPRWVKGVRYELKGSVDLETWFSISGGVIVDEGEGWESVVFDDLESIPGLQIDRGFFGLEVEPDAEP